MSTQRVTIQIVKSPSVFSPLLYAHWFGGDIPAVLKIWERGIANLPELDPGEAFARLVGVLARECGTEGVSIFNTPSVVAEPTPRREAGHVLVDISGSRPVYSCIGDGYLRIGPDGIPRIVR